MRVHVIETGRVVCRQALVDGPENQLLGFVNALFRPKKMSVPVHAYVLEHPDGLIVIDTGLHAETRIPRPFRSFIDAEPPEPSEECGPQMRAKGFRPEDVRWVIPTHLHLDHAGGLRHFPDAEILVHRMEYEKSPMEKRLDFRHLWPDWLSPNVYNLDPEPYHGFPSYKRLASDITLVPTPGHSPGHVGILVDTDGPTLFFAGDHCLSQERFASDFAADRLVMLGFAPKTARQTSRNIAAFVRDVPTMLIPAHDPTAATRLASAVREPVAV